MTSPVNNEAAPHASNEARLIVEREPNLSAGAAIRRRRRMRRVAKSTSSGRVSYRPMSMRDLEVAMRTLAEREPYLYAAYSRAVQVEIENRGASYLVESIRDHRVLNALIEVLFDGSVALFERETGVTLPLLRYLRKPRGAWREGDAFLDDAPPEAQEAAPHPSDLLIVVTSDANEPMLTPGQRVGVNRSKRAADTGNQLVAVAHPVDRALLLGVCQPGGEIRTAGGELVQGVSRDDVIGVAAWVGARPRRATS